MNWKTLAQNRAAIKKNVLVVGVDVAKKWHVVNVVYPNGCFGQPLRFYNDARGFEQLLAYIRKHQQLAGCDDALIGFESTGHYWMNLAHWLNERHFKLVQVNPLHTKRTRDMLDNSPSGSDPKSALTIAMLVSEGKYLQVILPQGVYAVLRELVLMRDQLMGERTSWLNRVHAALDRLFPEFTDVFKDIKSKTALYLLQHYPSPGELLNKSAAELTAEVRQQCNKSQSQKKIEALQTKARETVGVKVAWFEISAQMTNALSAVATMMGQIRVIEDELKRRVVEAPESTQLLSMRGIGLITTAVLLGETGGFRNYDHARTILKLAGMNVYVVRSGQWEGEHRITRRGRALLRKTLYMAALRLVRKGMALHEFYTGLVARGKRKKKAVVAAACRLVRILYALVRDERCYREHWPPAQPSAPAA
jgi:transposase